MGRLDPSNLSAPLPPYLPDDPNEFLSHVTTHSQEWLAFCLAAHEFMGNAVETMNAMSTAGNQLEADLKRKEEKHALEKSALQAEIGANQAIIAYQESQQAKFTQSMIELSRERDKALQLATPAVSTPLSNLSRPAENRPDFIPGTPPTTVSTSSENARLSEKLPDPDKFEGDRKDLRRFVSQIHEKMNVNRDRFPTALSRMAYVSNRLKGQPYAQILPYIKDGVCTLNDYDEMLKILDRAFGDPNRINNARRDLFGLRQNNKDFGMFFAEFQRLALEGEVSEETLPTLLEQAVNRELRGMLMHNEPPSREYHVFANFLQDLENRRRQYETAPAPSARNLASATSASIPRKATEVTVGPIKVTTPPVSGYEPMDTSRQPQASRKETGACFRCGSGDHRVRDCPHPDKRPVNNRKQQDSPSGSIRMVSLRGRSPTPSPRPASPTQGVSLNSMSLGSVATRL